jgi:hypothetical protein
MMPAKRQPRNPIAEAEENVLAALATQTDELATYSSTPHTAENQSRILTTIEILSQLKSLQEYGG